MFLASARSKTATSSKCSSKKLKSLGRKYEIVHKDSPSERGIDCAIIYDSAVFTLVEPQFHHVDADNTRDIVEAKLKRNGNDLYVFMDHWPSRFHEESYRNKAADVLRKRVDAFSPLIPKPTLSWWATLTTSQTTRQSKTICAPQRRRPPSAGFSTRYDRPIKAEGKGTIVTKTPGSFWTT